MLFPEPFNSPCSHVLTQQAFDTQLRPSLALAALKRGRATTTDWGELLISCHVASQLAQGAEHSVQEDVSAGFGMLCKAFGRMRQEDDWRLMPLEHDVLAKAATTAELLMDLAPAEVLQNAVTSAYGERGFPCPETLVPIV